MRRNINLIYDKLHRGVVKVCMATSVVGLVYIGLCCYDIVTKVRPQLEEKGKQAKEELLKEGREVLIDNTPSYKSL